MIRLAIVVLTSAAIHAQGVASRGVTAGPRPKSSGRPWAAKFTDISARAGFRDAVLKDVHEFVT